MSMNIITENEKVVKPEWDFERVKIAEDRLRKLRDGEPLDRIPLKFAVEGGPEVPPRDVAALDHEAGYRHQITQMNHVLNNFPEGDIIPVFTNVQLGQAFVPSLFGLEVIVDSIQPPYNHDRLIHDLETDLDKVPEKINPDTDGWGPKLRERIKFFINESEGRVPVALADHQSPYGVATKLMGNEELMIAMFDTPDLVHELMKRVTQATIDLARAIQRWAGGPELVRMNSTWPIPDSGIIIWDDYISVINPELHREFCLPYNMRLYEEFGFGHLHTCGPYFPNFLDSLLAHKGILSIDICSYIGPHSRSRDDLIELRRRTKEAGLILNGGLTTCDVVNFDGNIVQPDFELLKKMAQGGLIWSAGGTREQGLEYLQWADKVT